MGEPERIIFYELIVQRGGKRDAVISFSVL
jgi:hypothetical protein